LREEVEKILLDFDMSLSLYKDSSVLSRINRNENVKPDSFFIEAFNKSKEISAMTDGAFDLTVGPLVKAWGFGPDEKKSFNESRLDSLLNLIGMGKVEMRNGELRKSDPRITSGNYRKFYVENGIKYSHTIDPRTGYPARNQLLSATIVADDCATADGIATACMVMGKERTIDFLNLHHEFDAFLVYSDDQGNFRTWATRNLIEYISHPE
jgi:thiamine biosynthesis lipoprotein ApbE